MSRFFIVHCVQYSAAAATWESFRLPGWLTFFISFVQIPRIAVKQCHINSTFLRLRFHFVVTLRCCICVSLLPCTPVYEIKCEAMSFHSWYSLLFLLTKLLVRYVFYCSFICFLSYLVIPDNITSEVISISSEPITS